MFWQLCTINLDSAMSRKNSLRKDNPELLENQDILNLVEMADEFQDIKALADTAGGKLLIKYLMSDVTNQVYWLESNYKTATHEQLVTAIATMVSHLNTARLLINSKAKLEEMDEELRNALSA